MPACGLTRGGLWQRKTPRVATTRAFKPKDLDLALPRTEAMPQKPPAKSGRGAMSGGIGYTPGVALARPIGACKGGGAAGLRIALGACRPLDPGEGVPPMVGAADLKHSAVRGWPLRVTNAGLAGRAFFIASPNRRRTGGVRHGRVFGSAGYAARTDAAGQADLHPRLRALPRMAQSGMPLPSDVPHAERGLRGATACRRPSVGRRQRRIRRAIGRWRNGPQGIRSTDPAWSGGRQPHTADCTLAAPASADADALNARGSKFRNKPLKTAQPPPNS